MDWKRIDWARRSGGPIEADLIEAYAQGKINRRNFVKRGTMIGLSMPMMGAVIAACGSDDSSAGVTRGGGEQRAPRRQRHRAPASAAGGDVTAAIQTGDANSGLDPLNMLDLGTYSVLSQSFEYLVGLGSDGNIAATGLATEWSPNADGSQWTFKLRDGVTWQEDGAPLTSADVAATIDRMAEAGAGVAGVLSAGTTETPDDLTVVMNLDAPNGNLPVLVSLFNPQSLITPADYSSGTVLNDRSDRHRSLGARGFRPVELPRPTFAPNPNWWGGAVNLDSVTLQGFDSGGTSVAAFAAGEIDVLQSFSISDGATLLNDSSVTVLRPPSSNHRQLWFNTQLPEGGPFTDPRVRQAVGYAINRQQIVDTVYEGQAVIANDHPVYATLPFFDDTQEQRPYDPEMAKQLLSDAGYPDGIESVLQVGDLGEIPAIAAIVEQNLAAVGITTPVGVTPNSDFYGEYWCTGASYGTQPETSGPGRPCGASADIGIVDYGHRPTPDIFFGRALVTDGDWNSSNYASAEFDGSCSRRIKELPMWPVRRMQLAKSNGSFMRTRRPCIRSSSTILTAAVTQSSGLEVTALGHMQFQNVTKS